MFELTATVLLCPLAAFVLITFFTGKSEKISSLVSMVAMAVSLLSSLLIFALILSAPGDYELKIPWINILKDLPIEMGVLLNPVSSVMLMVVCTVSLFVQIYSVGYMHNDEGYSKYYSFISLFSFSMLGLVIANNLLQLYIFWELVGLCSYLLIGHWYHKPDAANAAKKAFVVTRFGDFGLLIAVIFLACKTGTFNFLEIERVIGSGILSPAAVTAVALLIFCGAAGKSAQFPLHIWLPDAMEGPTPISALIHAATMVAAGVYLVIRTYFIFDLSGTALSVIAIIGCSTAFMAGSIAIVQDDIKKVLAYSTISQLGYMMLALGVHGYTAGYFHLITHATFKALLFLGAGSVIHSLHTNNIWEMGRLFKNMKVTAVTFLIGGLALSGVYPTSGFFSKDAILIQTLESGHYVLFAVAFLTAGFTAFYMARVFFVVFLSKEKFSGKHPHESPAVMYVPLILLATLAVGLGFFSEGFSRLIFFGKINEPEHAVLIPLLSNLSAIGAIVLAWAIYQKELISAAALEQRFAFVHKFLKNKYYIDEMYVFCVKNILFVVSNAAGWFDRHIVDGAVNGAFYLTSSAAGALRKLQTGMVQNYAVGIFGGVILLWFFMNMMK